MKMKLPVQIDSFIKTQANTAAGFLNSRNPREKVMILALVGFLILTLDVMIFVQPLIKIVSRNLPQLSVLGAEAKTLQEDKKNKVMIHQKWEFSEVEIEDKQKTFVGPDEVPALLENLSKLANESSLKITSLKPIELPTVSETKSYSSVPIQISALAGTHEFGAFLGRLESGQTFFRVKDIKIAVNPMDEKRHLVELMIETYRKDAKT